MSYPPHAVEVPIVEPPNEHRPRSAATAAATTTTGAAFIHTAAPAFIASTSTAPAPGSRALPPLRLRSPAEEVEHGACLAPTAVLEKGGHLAKALRHRLLHATHHRLLEGRPQRPRRRGEEAVSVAHAQLPVEEGVGTALHRLQRLADLLHKCTQHDTRGTFFFF